MESFREAIVLLLMGSIVLTSLTLGLMATRRDVTHLARHPALFARSVLAMNVLTPAIAIVLLLASHVPPAVKVAVVVLTVSPVPPLLPSTQLKLGGHSRYVFGLLVTSALLSVGIVPATLALLSQVSGHVYGIAPLAVFRAVAISVLLPVLFGMAFRLCAPRLSRRLRRPLARIANVVLLVSFVPLLIVTAPAAEKLIGNGSVLVIATVVASGLAVGHLLGGPDDGNRTTLALACASRHPGVALAIVKANFAELHAGAALILFFVIGALVAIPYKKWRTRRALAAHAVAR